MSQFVCDICGKEHSARGLAVRCCSDVSSFSTVQATIQNWSAAGFRRASELEEDSDGDI